MVISSVEIPHLLFSPMGFLSFFANMKIQSNQSLTIMCMIQKCQHHLAMSVSALPWHPVAFCRQSLVRKKKRGKDFNDKDYFWEIHFSIGREIHVSRAHISPSIRGLKWVKCHSWTQKRRALQGIQSVLCFLTTWRGPLSSRSRCIQLRVGRRIKVPMVLSLPWACMSVELIIKVCDLDDRTNPFIVPQAHISKGCSGDSDI